MEGIAYLIKKILKKDGIGQFIQSDEKKVRIFVTVNSVSRNEWFEAGRNGFRPEISMRTAFVNYNGEDEVEYNGGRYAVYRTYRIAESDDIELYLQKKAGV